MAIHQSFFTNIDYDMLVAAAKAHPPISSVNLGSGNVNWAGVSPQCSAEALANMVETCRAKHGKDLFPIIDSNDIYKEARKIAEMARNKPGVWIWAAAEAYCQLAGTGVKWQTLPCTPDIVMMWIAVYKTAVGIDMAWWDDSGEFDHVRNGILMASGGNTYHSVSLYGWERERQYRTGWFGLIKKKAFCFMLETSNNRDSTWYLQAGSILTRGREAVVLIKG